MSRTAGVTCDILLTRIRQTGGLAVDKDFAMSVLSKCQRIVNAGLRRVLASSSIIPDATHTLNHYRNYLTDAIDVISIRSGTQELKRIDALNDLSAYDPNWHTKTGSRFEVYQQLGRDILLLYPIAVINDVINGTMELDSNWANYGNPSTNERSSEQAYTGTYSRKFIAPATSQGIQSDTWTSELGDYNGRFWAFAIDKQYINVAVRKGDDSGFILSSALGPFALNTWVQGTFSYTESAAGAGAYIIIYNPLAAGATWYVDGAVVTASTLPTVTYSKLTTAFSDYTDDYNDTLELPDEDVEIMLSLAEIILLIRYKQFNEAIGRMKQFKTEFAKYFGVFK